MRLHSVILWANMTTNAFALHIGLPRAENLYQIKRGNYGISLKLATRITQKFPDINKLWLLTGEGQMLDSAENRAVAVPFYDEDVCRAVAVVDELNPYSEIAVPDFAGCDFAMRLDAEADEGHTVIVLLRRWTGRRPAAGEYVAVGSSGEGCVVHIEGGSDGRGGGRSGGSAGRGEWHGDWQEDWVDDDSDENREVYEHPAGQLVCKIIGRLVINS